MTFSSTFNWHDTIIATTIAGSHEGGVRQIIRLTGAEALAIVESLFKPRAGEIRFDDQKTLVLDGHACLPNIPDIACSVYCWPAQRALTGQPLVEWHMPAGRVLADMLVAACQQLGARQAQPGEFSLRAFLAGKLDLIEAEGMLGVIHAQQLSELKRAIDYRAGGISGPIDQIRERLLDILADVEANLDFAHEDIEFLNHSELVSRLTQLQKEIDEIRQHLAQRTQAGDRPQVMLIGPANAGKSTLFNALIGSQAALVSDQIGTTRDVITAEQTWHGQPLELVDTAGLLDESQSADMFQPLADAKREELLRDSAIILWCHTSDQPPSTSEQRANLLASCPHATLIEIRTKSDLLSDRHAASQQLFTDASRPSHDDEVITLGNLTATGSSNGQDSSVVIEQLASLKQRVAELLATRNQPSSDEMLARVRNSLQAVSHLLLEARVLVEETGFELVAGVLREATIELGHITGKIYTEDLLDRVFSRFCIGK